jgi:hypothetical protein
MILTSKNKLIGFLFGLFGLVVLPWGVLAQGAVSLSVSPTLFEMSASPSQEWSSAVRVINTNSFPIKVYVNAVNFEPTGESGQGSMVPVLDSASGGATLAEWMTLPAEEIIIPAEQTVSVPFTINVPDDAAPGGHFAAILVGTRSLTSTDAPAQVETSQVVTSLVFLRVAGDIVERGAIRDFVTNQFITETPTASFSLRFENAGNVHLQPQGDITITNMWGKERGVIPINQTSQFGNVLPESIRNYTFEWTGDWSFADIGRYSAVATLAYGDQTRQFVNSTTNFWVIPWRTLLLITVVFGGLLAIIVWGIKLYIRKMLQMAGVTPALQRAPKAKRTLSITAPLEEGILDLRSTLRSGEGTLLKRLVQLVQTYKLFLIIVSAMLVFVVLFVWYLVSALSSERGYEVLYERGGEMIPVPAATQNDRVQSDGEATIANQPTVTIINRSGIAGLDQLRATDLESKGYTVTIARPDGALNESRTVIVYDPTYAEAAVILQEHFPDALLSSFVSADPLETPITIYVGSDQI